tara:strand:- start:230 stop:556 length:327 start_codon:yes stop_codon:yes gene_type:complete
MKTIILILAILISSLYNLSFANSSSSLNKRIEEKIIFNNGVLNLEKDKIEFVRISFKINAEGRIEILEMNYSNEKIKNLLVKQLLEVNIFESIDENETHNYHFTFKKQ